jgi:hypothetical protein
MNLGRHRRLSASGCSIAPTAARNFGLSDGFRAADWWDDGQRFTALRKGMFDRVPHAPHWVIGRVVEDLMLVSPDAWNYDGHQLPQPWANCCTYVV